MAVTNQLQKAGDYILDGPLIAGSSGSQYNFDSLVQEITIYQDLDSPYMSGSIFVTDASGLYEQLPIYGQERVLFTLRTPGASNQIDFSTYHGAILFKNLEMKLVMLLLFLKMYLIKRY